MRGGGTLRFPPVLKDKNLWMVLGLKDLRFDV